MPSVKPLLLPPPPSVRGCSSPSKGLARRFRRQPTLRLGSRHFGGSPYIADRKSTRLNSSHSQISYAVFCLKKKKNPLKSCSQADDTSGVYQIRHKPY